MAKPPDIGELQFLTTSDLTQTLTMEIEVSGVSSVEEGLEEAEVVPPPISGALSTIPVSAIRGTAVEEVMGLCLDPPGLGDLLQNWEHLAAAALPPPSAHDTIRRIRSQITYPQSPTRHLLGLLPPSLTLAKLLHILRDSMLRLDLCFKLIPLLHTLPHPSSSLSEYSEDESIPPHFPSTAGREITCFPRKSGARLLVSFYPGLEEMGKGTTRRRNIRWLVKNLEQSGEVERLDAYVERNGHTNLTLAIDTLFKMATGILVVVSPEYWAVSEDAHDSHAPDSLTRSILYLHSQMKAELIWNQSNNQRFYPLVWEGSGDEKYTPLFLRNILAFQWPKQHTHLFSLLFNLPSPSHSSDSDYASASK